MTTLVCLVLAVLAVSAPSGRADDGRAEKQRTIDLLSALIDAHPTTPGAVDALLGTELTLQRQDAHTEKYTDDYGVLTRDNAMAPVLYTASKDRERRTELWIGFQYVTHSCLPRAEILARFAPLQSYQTKARGAISPQTIYEKHGPWGAMRFEFSNAMPDCVSGFLLTVNN